MRSKANYIILFTVLIIFGLSIASLCFAQDTKAVKHIYVPEPASVVLVSTTGFFGYMVRFARKHFRKFKRYFDIVVSFIALVIISPIILFAALLVKMVSPGPAFFKQARVGLNGQVYDMYKLRTMRLDAERHTGPVWASENDDRIIRFGGRLIRKIHIDELPQLVNVLKGDMSLIGPRPERPVFVKELSKEISDYEKRLKIKPGITGLAQVRQKYDDTVRDVRRKVKFDLIYIRRMCLWLDMRILALTVVVALTGKGSR